MTKFNKVFIMAIVVIITICFNSNVWAKSFNKKAALKRFDTAKHMSNNLYMDNIKASDNGKALIDYLNSANVLTAGENIRKLAISNTVSGNYVCAIIYYRWLDLAYMDVRRVVIDAPDVIKSIDMSILKNTMLKSQIYQMLSSDKSRNNMQQIEKSIDKYFFETPTRAMVYNQKTIAVIWSGK